MWRELLGSAWYHLWYCATFGSSTLGFSFRFEGSRHLPRNRPVLLVANHQSFFDPILVGQAAGKRICYLARSTLFRNPLLGAMLHSVGVVPVDQEGVAKEGLKKVIELIQAGKTVLIFPEGTRTRTGEMQALRPGVLLILKRTLVPVVPVGVAGAFQLFPPHKKLPHLAPLFLPAPHGGLAVSIGKPVESQRYLDLPREQALGEMFDRIAEVQKRAEALRRKD